MKGEVSNSNSCYQRAEPLLQSTECCPPDGHSLPSSLLPPQGLALLQPREILLPAQTPRAALSGELPHSPLLSSRQHHSLLPLEQAWNPPARVPALPAGCPKALTAAGKHSTHTGSRSTQELHVLIKVWLCDCFGDTAPDPGTREVAKGERKEKVLPSAGACTSANGSGSSASHSWSQPHCEVPLVSPERAARVIM